jgi:phosphoserine phosphatase
MSSLILQGPSLTQSIASDIATQCQGIVSWHTHFAVIECETLSTAQLSALRSTAVFDINQLPEGFDARQVGLVVSDMDSTLISIECIDEIADFMSLKPQVAAITESAMRGEIDFETSLRQRVALLKGLDVGMLDRVYEERLQLNPGAETMIATLKAQGIKFALVSGGFTFFTDRLKERLGLDFTQANELGIENGRLTGEVVGDICGAQAKETFLLSCCKKLDLTAKQALAVGDGANDLVMMQPAGLSVAYHAKPKVQSEAATALNHTGLEGILGLLQLEFN